MKLKTMYEKKIYIHENGIILIKLWNYFNKIMELY